MMLRRTCKPVNLGIPLAIARVVHLIMPAAIIERSCDLHRTRIYLLILNRELARMRIQATGLKHADS
jgi:hypothetical protein